MVDTGDTGGVNRGKVRQVPGWCHDLQRGNKTTRDQLSVVTEVCALPILVVFLVDCIIAYLSLLNHFYSYDSGD